MPPPDKRLRTTLLASSWVLTVPLATFYLLITAAHLFGSEETGGVEDTIVFAMLTVTALCMLFALRRPRLGGVLVAACVVPHAIVFNAFGISALLIPNRPVGLAGFWSATSVVLVVLAVLSITRGRLQHPHPD